MKLPRDIDGPRLVRALRVLGYEVTRQKGSYIRITTMLDGEHHEAVPAHSPIKTGTLAGILKGIAAHHRLSVAELLTRIDL
jgi:predicted RNA binding protein YcfA (HicA-like mRNA interferase family)